MLKLDCLRPKVTTVLRLASDILVFLFNFRYEPELLSCPLTSLTEVPHAVSLTNSPCETATNYLKVTNHGNETERKGSYVNLTICVAPLIRNINDVEQLVEFIEINNLFGGQRFVFYKASCGSDYERYLAQYKLQGLVDDVIPWNLPRETDPNRTIAIKYHGQYAVLTDCLYRNIYKTKYVAFLDIDEILVSRAPSVSSVLTFLKPNPDVCNYQFKHVLFRKSWPDDEEVSQDSAIATYQVHSLLKTKRDDHIWAFNKRSKYIAKADMLEIPGIHYAHSCIHENWHPGIIKEDHGLLHHYRRMGSSKLFAPAKFFVRDYTLQRYRDDIIERIKRIHTIMYRRNTTVQSHVESRTDNVRIWYV